MVALASKIQFNDTLYVSQKLRYKVLLKKGKPRKLSLTGHLKTIIL